jgi:hypothetical protein
MEEGVEVRAWAGKRRQGKEERRDRREGKERREEEGEKGEGHRV